MEEEYYITTDMDLDVTNPEYDSQNPYYQELEDCFIGAGQIEDANEDIYLIKKGNESDDDYIERKRRAIYYNKCAQVVSTFQGHLWRKSPIRELPKTLEEYIEDVDKQKTNANDFFKNITEQAQVLGMYFVYIDFPQNLYCGDQSICMDKELGYRPKMIPIDPRNVLDWAWDSNNDLKYVVIAEEVEIVNEPFLTKQTETHYRLIKPYIQYIFRKDDNGKPYLIETRENTLGKIPLIPFYGKKISKMVGQSVLHDICGLNLELYNKHTQRDMAEYWSAFPIPFFKMFKASEMEIGPQNGIFSMDENSDVRLVEFSGASIKSLKEAEEDILREIFDLALKQIRANSAQRQTVDSKRLDRMDALSDLQARALSFQQAEKKCWELFGLWLDVKDDINIQYNIDYNVSQMEYQMVEKLLSLVATNVISKRTYREILQAGEILPDNFDIDKEDQNIEDEKPEEERNINEEEK